MPREAGATVRARGATTPKECRTAPLAALCAVALALAASPRRAGAASCSVGSFVKTTSAAPVTQTVAHGLGETPKAIIFWSETRTATGSFTNSYRLVMGFTDGTTSGSVSTSGQDNVSPSNESRRMADKAITIVEYGNVLRAEADLQSWDATNFVLDWTTNNASSYIIHFLAVGGKEVSARVLSWTMKTSTGNQSVTGTSFTPDLVLHIHAGAGFTSTPPATGSNGGFGFGAMEYASGQWANTILTTDGSTSSNTQRYQRTNQTIVAIDSSATVVKEASLVSMDSTGFTLNFTTANNQASQVYSLALAGVRAKAGSFTKTTSAATATQAITGVPLHTRAILLASVQNTASTSGASQARYGIGASDGTTEGSTAISNTDSSNPTNLANVTKTDKVFMKVNNSGTTIDAEADTASLDAAGFTLSWTTNDAVATEILYLALQPQRRIAITRRSLPTRTAGASAPHARAGAWPSRATRAASSTCGSSSTTASNGSGRPGPPAPVSREERSGHRVHWSVITSASIRLPAVARS